MMSFKKINNLMMKHYFLNKKSYFRSLTNRTCLNQCTFKQCRHFTTIVDIKNSSLEQHLRAKIKLKGPITVAEYMKEALTNPVYVRILYEK